MQARPPQPARPGLEAWVLCAFGLVAAEAAGAIYLGSRPGGRGPVLAYYIAPAVLGGAAVALAAWGIARSLRRRPFARPARLLAFTLLAFVVGSASYPLPFPAQREDRPSRVALEFPLQGEWTVQWGGAESDRNLLARSRPDRRFGYDLVLERDGARHKGGGERLEDWHAFGAEVRAPCDGTVVRAVDGIADVAPAQADGGGDVLGNYVALEIAPGEFLFLANLQRGSIGAQPGERVARGARLGSVGNSGTQRFTSGPHLALHLQDTPEPRWGQGIPFAFRGVLVDGRAQESAQPRGRSLFDRGARGERVRRAE
jgi:murein DD-endopeptidase MepM/ murein hydrolase activator NlpD